MIQRLELQFHMCRKEMELRSKVAYVPFFIFQRKVARKREKIKQQPKSSNKATALIFPVFKLSSVSEKSRFLYFTSNISGSYYTFKATQYSMLIY